MCLMWLYLEYVEFSCFLVLLQVIIRLEMIIVKYFLINIDVKLIFIVLG